MPSSQPASSAQPVPTRPAMPEALRWLGFRVLEQASAWRSATISRMFELDSAGDAPGRPAMWLYVSTIGELNAVAPALDWLIKERPDLIPVLITDHPHYRDAYRARYPSARICVSRGYSPDAARLAAQYPPQLLAVAEIPGLPSDAPCRFSYAFVRRARTAGAKLLLLNGWLYHYGTSARLDALERRWFQHDYLRSFDALCVQNESTRLHLLERGAEAKQLHLTGNMKFDAMQRPNWQVEQARSPGLLSALLESRRPVVVAGCVTDAAEQAQVLQAFVQLKAQHPLALLILAPRHPENAAAMQSMAAVLARFEVRPALRTQLPDAALPPELDCLVLDTVGELRDFYAVANVSHVGVDHNVLEPLGFDKPVSVVTGWNPTYPSFPVYQLLRDSGALHDCLNPEQLAQCWGDALSNSARTATRIAHAQQVLATARGAVARHVAALAPHIRPARSR